MSEPGECPECGTRRVDALPSRGECQTCLRARMEALDRLMTPPNKPLAERLRELRDRQGHTCCCEPEVTALLTEAADEIEALQHDVSRSAANHSADLSE